MGYVKIGGLYFMFLFKYLKQRICLTDLSNRLFHSASWALVGAVVGRGVTMLTYIIVARLLTQEVYGEFGILRSTINMFTVFAGMGLGSTASKYISGGIRGDGYVRIRGCCGSDPVLRTEAGELVHSDSKGCHGGRGHDLCRKIQ